MKNPIMELLDNYFAWLLVLAGMVLLVFHFKEIAQGTGTLTTGAATFVKAFA